MDYAPLSGREQPRFAGVKTFFRLPHAPLDADWEVGVFGIPYDGAVSYRPGARFAPAAVREMSSMGRGHHMTRAVNWVERLRVADLGDCPTAPVDQAQTYAHIEGYWTAIARAGKRAIAVGGDHSTTLASLRGLAAVHGPLNLIHFDAHLDTFPAAWGCDYHHGAFLRHALEEGVVDGRRTLQVGIRGPLAAASDVNVVRDHGVRVTTVDDVRMGGLEAFIADLPAFLDGPTYLSFDIDCLDPAYAPGTGTPVPGGLTTYEGQRILRALAVGALVGGDVVEVSPPFDVSGITALAAMDVVFELLCMMAAPARGGGRAGEAQAVAAAS